MGAGESKPEEFKIEIKPLKSVETGTFNIKTMDELPKIDLSLVDLPKAPPVVTRKQEKKNKEAGILAGQVPFSLKTEFDTETYGGRFKMLCAAFNPLLFFRTNAQIKEAQDIVFKHKCREEAAENMGSKVMMNPADIKILKDADKVVSGSVHPDTNEIIPFPMRMTANVWFNGPTLMIMLFTRN